MGGALVKRERPAIPRGFSRRGALIKRNKTETTKQGNYFFFRVFAVVGILIYLGETSLTE
jgi:hypothetical protein